MINLIQLKKVNMKPMITQSWQRAKSFITVVMLFVLAIQYMNAQTLVAVQATDTSVCPGASAVYAISPATGTWTFSLPNGGGSIATSSATSVTINWGTVPGTYFVSATDGATTVSRRVWIEGDFSLACDDLVNVSVDEFCSATITASVLLEGNRYPEDSYDVTVYNTDGSVVPKDLVTGAHIGKQLKVHIRHICTGIACWGYIKVEDKYIPNLVCADLITVSCSDGVSPEVLGFPVPSTATILPKRGEPNCYIVRGFDLCCDVELCYSDIYTKYGCNAPVYAQYVRNWVARDCKGNTKSCSQTIDVLQGTFAGIICPPNYDNFDLPYLKCDDKEPAVGPYPSGWNALDNGNPSPYDYRDQNGNLIWSGTGYPLNVNCDHLAVTYRDLKIPVCGSSFKIFRNWKIFDWCTGEILECNQLIKVVDHKPPIVSCTNNFMVFPMDYYTCTGSAIVTGPELIIDCSSTTLAVSYKKAGPDGTPEDGDFRTAGVTYLSGGRVRIAGLPADTSWVRYTVTDDCGNETRCVVEVIIEDDLDPVAVCDQHTVVTLGDSGVAKVFATSFDQGSFDNCTLDSILVRRMTDNCGVVGNTSFGTSVKFCCEDVSASPITVVLRVKDKNGNFNDCMVQVTVQDKVAPDITCPRNISVPCTTDIYDLSIVGRPTVKDNCGTLTPTFVDDSTGFKCNTGTIRRRWKAEDAGGRFDLCDQIITIIDPSPLTRNQINWPNLDLTVNGCTAADAHPDVIRSFPTWSPRPCANIIRGYEDEKFYNVDNVCVKILRKWRVIDWCQYDVNNPNTVGIWDTVQVIKLVNSRRPDFAAVTCATSNDTTQNSRCDKAITLIGYATDDCTDTTELIWSYSIDFDNNGTFDVNASGRDASGTYRSGSHRIRWTVKDLCGNTNTCDKIFNINDSKQPTPFCKPGLITVVMGTNGSIAVRAKDFNEKSEDNCTPSSRLRFAFSQNPNDSVRTYTCADIPNGISRDTSVSIYVFDERGNFDFCVTRLTLQDNQGNACPNRVSGGTVSGLVSANTNSPLKGAFVELMKSNNKMGDLLTLESGFYTFLDLPVGDAYDLMPSKNDDISNGVTTADIVAIQKHILGQQTFNSAFQYIAADANNSGTISAADIADLRKIILGINQEFRNGQKSWRFVKKGHQFEDDSNPWLNNGWPEFVHVDNLQGDLNNLDFTAIKIGDLNLTARTNLALSSTSRTQDVSYFELTDQLVPVAQETLIPVFFAGNKPLAGFQMSLKSDMEHVEIVGLQSGEVSISTSNFNITKEGIMNISWNDYSNMVSISSKPAFYIVANVNKAVVATQAISLSKALMVSEAYTSELEIMGIELRAKASGKVLKSYELFQNTPNPFGNQTTISFYAPESSDVIIRIRDVAGKEVISRRVKAKTGVNQLALNSDELNGHLGILFYTLESNNFSATRKMILVK